MLKAIESISKGSGLSGQLVDRQLVARGPTSLCAERRRRRRRCRDLLSAERVFLNLDSNPDVGKSLAGCAKCE